MRAYRFLGQIISVFGWPVMRLIMWHSTRSYILLRHNNQILVLKTWLGIKSEWRLPGGGNKKNEDPKQALIRELFEETKIEIKPKQLLGLGAKSFRSNWSFDYWLYSANLSKKPQISIDKFEIIDAQWINIEKLSDLPCSEELKKAIKTV